MPSASPLRGQLVPAVAADPYARCRECGSRNVEGIAPAHAVGKVGRNGEIADPIRFEVAFAPADRASLLCADCGSWNVRPPEALRDDSQARS